MAVNVQEIIDKWNDKKIWLVKRYGCGHYYFNQSIAGHVLNKNYTKTTKAYLKSIGLKANVIEGDVDND